MRILVSIAFVFGGMVLVVALLSWTGAMAALGPNLSSLALSLAMLTLCAVALGLFTFGVGPWAGRESRTSLARRLERRGLLAEQNYVVKRAFGVNEYEDEGPHYFLQLEDGGVLSLTGRYLWAYEPREAAPGPRQGRKFPCTAFTLRRHLNDHFVVDLQCSGTVLEPEFFAPPFGRNAWGDDEPPTDGELIQGTSYDQLADRLRPNG